jgi:hypothetical protein
MMPFSVFGPSNATDRVTLHKQNPFFDKALQKDALLCGRITYRRSQIGSDIFEACAFFRSVYGPPVGARAGTRTTTPAFDDEVEVEKDTEQQQQ